MKHMVKWMGILLCMLLLVAPIHGFALDEEDPYYEEPETEYETVVTSNTTVPHGSLTTERTTAATTTKAPKPVDPPLVKITRDDLPAKPKPGQTFTMTVVFHNYSGVVSLRSGLASFEPSDGLVLAENSASKVVPVIETNGVRSVQIRLRVPKDVSSQNQSVSVTYTYSYKTTEGLQQAEATEKLLLTVVPTAENSSTERHSSPSATPNIIVDDYSYGGTITAGESFTLRLQFHNTSKKIPVENIVMSIETGNGITITSASNTYYYASLGAGKGMTQSIPMRVAANADPDGAKIDISFRYEYVEGDTRSDSTASERLSVPIFIPDRFTVSEPDTELIGTQNEELSVSLPYVNKSRVDVSNVSAELLYDDAAVFCEQPRINLGNFEPGKSGTIDFYFTPLEVGNGTVTVRVKYEDELMQEKQMDVRVSYSVEEGYVDPGTEEPMDIPEETPSSPVWLRFVIPGAVLAAVIVIVVVVVRKHKKKKSAAPAADFDWDTPQEVTTHEDH